MGKFSIEPLTDLAGNKYWLLFEHGTFHAPTCVIDDLNMVAIANKILGRTLDGRPITPDLKVLRERTGLTLKEVSEATGMSVSYLSDLERGNRGVYTVTEKVMKVIDFLNGYPEEYDGELSD